ncbi:site-specific integrase [Caballeronia sp. LjRoot34]|uniref:hypothetical protein n=1 Tax=Caballeronia sp. LjRoot34 TaxID=3342325 RepID=UPI003ECD1528
MVLNQNEGSTFDADGILVYRGVPIRPISYLTPSAYLSGDSGINRAMRRVPTFGLTDDIAAVRRFLGQISSAGTLRVYEREIDRLLLWAWAEAGKPLSGLTAQDFQAYSGFLSDPRPKNIWCSRKTRRDSVNWRPFEGPLQEKAKNTAISVATSLMAYLVEIGYLCSIPIPYLREKSIRHNGEGSVTATREIQERTLDRQCWEAINGAIELMPQTNQREIARYERIRFFCAFIYHLAPRARELERGTLDSFVTRGDGLWWKAEDKTFPDGHVRVSPTMETALERYLKNLRLTLPDLDAQLSKIPLLRSTSTGQSISSRRLNQLLKPLFARAAELLPGNASREKEMLLHASVHWLRHTGIKAHAESGVGPAETQKFARHAKAESTQPYLREQSSEELHEQANRKKLQWPANS